MFVIALAFLALVWRDKRARVQSLERSGI